MRLLQNKSDAEDMVQGLFVDLLEKGRQEMDLPYLYRAVTNRCINFLRYGENRKRLLTLQDEKLRGPLRTRCDERVIQMDLLDKLIHSLDQKSAETLVYRYFDDMSQDEIARIQNTSRKTIGKRLIKIHELVEKLTQNEKKDGNKNV